MAYASRTPSEAAQKRISWSKPRLAYSGPGPLSATHQETPRRRARRAAWLTALSGRRFRGVGEPSSRRNGPAETVQTGSRCRCRRDESTRLARRSTPSPYGRRLRQCRQRCAPGPTPPLTIEARRSARGRRTQLPTAARIRDAEPLATVCGLPEVARGESPRGAAGDAYLRPTAEPRVSRPTIPLRATATALRPDAGVPKRSPQTVAQDELQESHASRRRTRGA